MIGCQELYLNIGCNIKVNLSHHIMIIFVAMIFTGAIYTPTKIESRTSINLMCLHSHHKSENIILGSTEYSKVIDHYSWVN